MLHSPREMFTFSKNSSVTNVRTIQNAPLFIVGEAVSFFFVHGVPPRRLYRFQCKLLDTAPVLAPSYEILKFFWLKSLAGTISN